MESRFIIATYDTVLVYYVRTVHVGYLYQSIDSHSGLKVK